MPAKRTVSKTDLVSKMKEAGDVFKICARKTKILSSLAWKPEVAEEFFQRKETEFPKPKYEIDRKTFQDVLDALTRVKPKIQGEHPVLQWLERTRESFTNGIQLLLEIEKDGFHQLSSTLYGNSGTKVFRSTLTNIELARALSGRMSVCNLNDVTEHNMRVAEEFAHSLEENIQGRHPMLPVKVELTEQIVAKVVAGMNRVRIRKDAKFSEIELSALWNHEIESHCLTAHNGNHQDICDFLAAGGPRTTMTQEGLAVFYEVYGHTMSQRRFLSLCDRIEAVRKVEDGADFLELYRWYKDRCEEPREAFYNTQRMFRGAKLTGKGPFTKDVVYLAGLLGVYNFLRIAVKSQNRLLVESLVCGRISLEDVGTIAWLRQHDILKPPYFIPDWLKNWEALLSFFSLTAVFGSMDLSGFQSHLDDYYTLDEWDLSF